MRPEELPCESHQLLQLLQYLVGSVGDMLQQAPSTTETLASGFCPTTAREAVNGATLTGAWAQRAAADSPIGH